MNQRVTLSRIVTDPFSSSSGVDQNVRVEELNGRLLRRGRTSSPEVEFYGKKRCVRSLGHWRSAAMGSTFAARQAGSKQATTPAKQSTRTAEGRVTGS